MYIYEKIKLYTILCLLFENKDKTLGFMINTYERTEEC